MGQIPPSLRRIYRILTVVNKSDHHKNPKTEWVSLTHTNMASSTCFQQISSQITIMKQKPSKITHHISQNPIPTLIIRFSNHSTSLSLHSAWQRIISPLFLCSWIHTTWTFSFTTNSLINLYFTLSPNLLTL